MIGCIQSPDQAPQQNVHLCEIFSKAKRGRHFMEV